jgi:hypothetical protein
MGNNGVNSWNTMGMYIIVILLEWRFNQQEWGYETNKSWGFAKKT